MEAVAFKVVLDGTATLDGRVDADADYAQAKEEKHCDPLEYGDACALAFDLSHTMVITIRTRDLLRSFPCPLFSDFLQRNRLILDIGKVYLLDWGVLAMRYLVFLEHGRWPTRDIVVLSGGIVIDRGGLLVCRIFLNY